MAAENGGLLAPGLPRGWRFSRTYFFVMSVLQVLLCLIILAGLAGILCIYFFERAQIIPDGLFVTSLVAHLLFFVVFGLGSAEFFTANRVVKALSAGDYMHAALLKKRHSILRLSSRLLILASVLLLLIMAFLVRKDFDSQMMMRWHIGGSSGYFRR